MFLIIIIFASLVAFVYFKVQQSRATDSAEKRSSSFKGNIAIGFFFIAFGTNSWLNLQSTVAAVVGLVFVVFGSLNIFLGYKHYRLIKPYLEKKA